MNDKQVLEEIVRAYRNGRVSGVIMDYIDRISAAWETEGRTVEGTEGHARALPPRPPFPWETTASKVD